MRRRKAITTNQYRKEPLSTPRSWEPLTYIDATPDEGYVLRILESHLANCRSGRWGGTNKTLVDAMNRFNDQRAKQLEVAIFSISPHRRNER